MHARSPNRPPVEPALTWSGVANSLIAASGLVASAPAALATRPLAACLSARGTALPRLIAGPCPQDGAHRVAENAKSPGLPIPGRSHCAEGVTFSQIAN